MTARSDSERLDELTRRRLGQLASRPVDVSAVASRLRAEMDKHRGRRDVGTLALPVWARWAGPAAVAAVLLIAAASLWVTGRGGSAVYAAPAEMARLHRDLINGRAPVIPVADLAEAGRTIESGWREAPALPANRGLGVRACCLSDVQSRRVACILLEQDEEAVTIVVARTEDFYSPEGPTVEHNGRRYSVASRDGLNMVMTRQRDRWMCLMSELTQERLLHLAETMAE